MMEKTKKTEKEEYANILGDGFVSSNLLAKFFVGEGFTVESTDREDNPSEVTLRRDELVAKVGIRSVEIYSRMNKATDEIEFSNIKEINQVSLPIPPVYSITCALGKYLLEGIYDSK